MTDKTATITLLSQARAQLTGEYDDKAVDEALSYFKPGYQRSPAYQAHLWDGKVHLFAKQSGTFPAGLRWRVKRVLRAKGYRVIAIRGPKAPLHALPITHTNKFKLGGVTLYPWQKFAIRQATTRKQGVLKVATGGGKTEIMAGVIRALEGERPPKTLVIVPNRNLLRQTRERLEERLKYEVGQIGHGQWNEDWVTVAIPPTLQQKKHAQKLKTLLQNAEVLFLDECHHTSSTTWSKIATRAKASHRFGLSATPLDRQDGANLRIEGVTGPVIVDIKAESLVRLGVLAKPTIHFVDVSIPKLPDDLSWEDVYRLGIVKNGVFHRKIEKLLLKHAADATLVLVTRIEHGNDLLKHAPESARFVHGSTPKEEIEEAVRDFKAGKFKTLIASPIFGEGTDIPNIDVLIIADGGKSIIRTLQKVGRALRKKRDKPNTATIYDFTHRTHKRLGEHSVSRWQAYVREKFECKNPPRDLVEDNP